MTKLPPNVDLSELEETSSAIPVPPELVLPAGGGIGMRSLRADSTSLTLLGDPPTAIVIAVGRSFDFGFHASLDAEAARVFAAQLLKCADLLDGGKGKQ